MARADRQSLGAFLENEEDNQVTAGCCSAHSCINIFTFHIAALRKPNMRLMLQNIFYLFRANIVLGFDLIHESLDPDNFADNHF